MSAVVSLLSLVLLAQSVAWLGGETVSARRRQWAVLLAPAALLGVSAGLGGWLMAALGGD